MYYELEDIIQFTKDIQFNCQTGIPALLYVNYPHKTEAKEGWLANKKRVNEALDAYRLNPQALESLEAYAQTVNLAGQWLKHQFICHEKVELGFFNKHIELLIGRVKALLPRANFNFPKPIFESSSIMDKGLLANFLNGIGVTLLNVADEIEEARLPKTPEAQNFLNSKAFENLKNYRDFTLKNDQRNHRFFGVNLEVSKKYQVLNELILALEAQTSLENMKYILNKFYESKDSWINNWLSGSKGYYDILNSGQNITTMLLGSFGLKTTTISLIDALNDYAQNTNEITLTHS